MSNTTQIVLSGYYGFDNIGDEAVLYSIISTLKREIEGVEIIVLSHNPEKTKALYGVKSVDRWKLKEVVKVIKASDLLISGGGSLLQDVTGIKTIPYYLTIVKIAQFYKKKVVFYSQGIGPVNKNLSRWLIKTVVKKVNGIYVRDKGSKMLLEEIGIKKTIGVAIDPVLGIEVPKETIGEPGEKRVGIYIRPWIDEHHDRNMIKSMVPGLMDLLQKDYKLCFIPMHYEQDKEIAERLAKAVKKAACEAGWDSKRCNQKIEVIDKMLSVKEVMIYTAGFNMVIGMRLHSLIMATACKIPTLGLSYDPKVTEFMKEIQNSHCIQTTELTEETFLAEVQAVERAQEIQKQQIESILNEKKERLYLPIECIKNLI